MKTPAENIDMSAGAIARRLEDVRGLYRLKQYLGRFRPVDPIGADVKDPSRR
jgi:hypothetical protein